MNKINRLGWITGTSIAIAACAVPALILLGLALAGLIRIDFLPIWLTVYFAWNFRSVPANEWHVIERAGRFWTVKLAGWRLYCMLGLIDKIKKQGSFRDTVSDLFCNSTTDSGREEIDFTDDSAGIVAKMWKHVGRDGGTKEELTEDILRYVYATDQADKAAVEIAEDNLRPELQKRSIDEAQKDRPLLVNTAEAEVAEHIKQYGLYLRKTNPIVIADILLSKATEELRRKRLEGTTTANETENEAEGIQKAIAKIAGAEGCNFETARGIWERQETRKMFVKTGANINIVASGPEGVVKMFDVNK